MATDVLVVFCTFPAGDKAAEVARTLVEEQLAACVNIVPGVRSIYSWQGKVCDDAEQLAVIKTTAARFEDMRTRLVTLHPYEVPEVVGMPVAAGHEPYLAWVRGNTESRETGTVS
jgi:periplasmic divalent cation tolerance protein